MKPKLDTVITTLLVLCALVTTGLLIRREFAAPAAASSEPERQPVFVEDWRAYLEQGVRFGPTEAPVQLIEFADFECPFCGSFHKTLKALRERYPAEVSLSFVHFPLEMHRFAQPAARVAECAGDQGRFEAMHDRLFEHQEGFGLKSWIDYAVEAGVPDIEAFNACIKKTGRVKEIEIGKELAGKLNVQATPTLIINGWKLVKPPTIEELDEMVKKVLAGKAPIS